MTPQQYGHLHYKDKFAGLNGVHYRGVGPLHINVYTHKVISIYQKSGISLVLN